MGGQTHKHQPRTFHQLPALEKALIVQSHATARMNRATSACDTARVHCKETEMALEDARRKKKRVNACESAYRRAQRAYRATEARAMQTGELVETLTAYVAEIRAKIVRDADIKVVSVSKKLDKAMIIVRVNGRSETRHVQRDDATGKWMGMSFDGGTKVAYPLIRIDGHIEVDQRAKGRKVDSITFVAVAA